MTLPWEPPPHHQPQPPVVNTRNTNTTNSSTYRTTKTTSTSNNNGTTLGDFDVLLSFLHLERTSLATPSTAGTVSTTTTTTSAAPPSPPAGIPSSISTPTWGIHSKDDTLSPLSSTSTSQLGDLSMVMRYLQAHKTYSSSSSSPTPTLPLLAQTIQNRDPEPADTNEVDDEDEDSLGTSRRRLKKKATKKLPIDEPSSSSCGGWVSSESDHKEEEVMGRAPSEAEEPDLVVLQEATRNPQPPPNSTIATITDFLAKELEQHPQQEAYQILMRPTDTTTQQLNSLALSTHNVGKPNHITLPPPPTVTTNNKIAAVANASASGTSSVAFKKKRPWHTAKVLREMKALFIQEQERKQLHRKPTLDSSRLTCISTAELKTASTATSSTMPITLVTPRKAQEKKQEREIILNLNPEYEPELLRRPRTHYNNFWRTCTETNTSTAAGGTTTDTNRSSSSSSSSEEETPFRFGRGRINTPATASSASAFGSTTSTCLSEATGKSAESKRLLALRVRDTFLVPRGTSLLYQALSHAEAHLPETVPPLPLEERSEPVSATRLELGTMKSLTRIADKSGSAPINTTSIPTTEQSKFDPTPSPPKAASATTPSNERVFIFVDNSNILHGFHQIQHQLDAQRVADGISVDGTSTSNRQDNHHHHQQHRVLPHKSLSNSAEALGLEDGMALATPDAIYDDGITSFPPGTNTTTSTTTSNGPRAKMARGSHRFPKFNYSKFFDLLKRDRTAARQVLVGSSPLFQELDEAMEHQYETIILRRVKKFVQGELGAIPVPVKQLRFPSSFSYGGGSANFCDGTDASVVDNSTIYTTSATTSTTTLPTTTAAAGSGSGGGGGAQGEQGVDELLHLKMLETLLDHEPATIVLASGDGGDSEFGGGGFYAVIKRALNRGWHVEVVSWEDQLSGVYLELALEYGYNCEHKLTTTPDGGKRCHALSTATTFETVMEPDRLKKQKKQQKYPPPGTKKQKRALALALAQAQEKEKEKERESRQCGCGHLRVWCLDWYGDILLQPTPSTRSD